ncbi:MAG: hypothetical protein IPQ09_13370 [Myxococcales bacterium]|nr:hypothetical protein [Myxococcales bacterium]
MDGKGKGPRVEYLDDDIALTQKLTRPKLPPQPMGPESAPSLQPKQGGAVDAEALRRIRRVSAPNLLAIRMPGDPPPADTADRTVARARPLPGEAFLPPSEAAPSTIPEAEESTRRQRKGDLGLAPLVGSDDEADSETSPDGFSDAMTKQVPADVARRLLSEVAAMDPMRASMSAAAPDPLGATLPVSGVDVGLDAPTAPHARPEIQPIRQAAPLAARAAPAPPAPPGPPLAPPTPPPEADRRDPAQTLASLPKPTREAPGFHTLPLGSSSVEVGMALRSAEAAPPASAPSSRTPAFGSTHLMPQSMPLPLVTPASPQPQQRPVPPAAGSTFPMAVASSSVPSLGASGSVPSLGALGASGSVASLGTVPPGSGGSLSGFSPHPGGVTLPPTSAAIDSSQPAGVPRKGRGWVWALLAVVLALVGLALVGGFLAKRRNPSVFSVPYKVG